MKDCTMCPLQLFSINPMVWINDVRGQLMIRLAIWKSLALRSRYSVSEQYHALSLGVRVPVYFLVRHVECSKWHEADRQKYCLEGFDEDCPWLPGPRRLAQVSRNS